MTDQGSPVRARRVRFGTFEVDFRERELRNGGVRVNLQRKPFQILELLLRQPGALVTREELARYLWPDLHVSFSHSLNTAVNTLRQALGDSPTSARYIETRSGLGYRFIAKVEEIAENGPGAGVKKRYDSREGPYQDYRKGKYLQGKLTRAELGKSIAHFEAAIAQDRRYAPAYAGLAETYISFALLGLLPPREARRRAQENARMALEIDPSLAEARVAMARVRHLLERDCEQAEAECLRAIELEADHVEAYLEYASVLAASGRMPEALHKMRRALDVEPLSLAVLAEAAWIHYVSRNFEEAANQSWQALVLEPRFALAQHTLGLAYEQMGMSDEAITELNNARQCSENHVPILAGLAHALARSGKREEAERTLESLEELAREQHVSAYWRSIAHLGFDSESDALSALEQAVEEDDLWLVWLKAEPRFDGLRGSARFGRVVERLEERFSSKA
ncbi:MAG TPA: winged helix-turn-helix domain-containing protein [Bryobacteraceae bacterium]|jgi:serine/threonine-protein kinase|nr:winged helix-turn-helix domain-containing protein [Bryobacteraceae bacterium]